MATDPHTEYHLEHLENIWRREVQRTGPGLRSGLLNPVLGTLAGSMMCSLLLLARDHDVGGGPLRDIDIEFLGIWHENGDRSRGVLYDFSPRACWDSLINGAIETPRRHRRAIGALKQLFGDDALRQSVPRRRATTLKAEVATVPEDNGFLIPYAGGCPERIYNGFRGLFDWLIESGNSPSPEVMENFAGIRHAFPHHRVFNVRDRFGGAMMAMTVFRHRLEIRLAPCLALHLHDYVTRFDPPAESALRRAA